MKRLNPWFALLILALLAAGCAEPPSPTRLEGRIFGSFYQVTIADPIAPDRARALEAGIVEVLEQVDAAMSTYRDDSELVAFNNSPVGEWQSLSPGLMEVLAISREIAEASGGAFDITVGGLVNLWSFGPEARPLAVPDDREIARRLMATGPDTLELDPGNSRARRHRDVFVDLSAVAKGYAGDRVAAYLDDEGIAHYLVNLGGDLVARGYRDGTENPWRIGIEVPVDGPQTARHVLPVLNTSIATSGDYRNYFEQDGKRFSHTIDPRNGYPVDHGLASASVIHPDNARADAWATALMVLGPDQGMSQSREHNLKVLLLVRSGDSWATRLSPAFREHFDSDIIEALEAEP